MLRYIVKRLVATLPVLLGVSFFTAAIIQITPGDPVRQILGEYANPELVEELRNRLGLNDPFWQQYLRFLAGIAQGDLGTSIQTERPVAEEILTQLPYTLSLAVGAMTFGIFFGLLLGVVAGITRNRLLENSIVVGTIVAVSMPVYWLAILLLMVFGVQLRWVSVTGGTGWQDAVLPIFALGIGVAAVITRLTQANIQEVMHEDFVRTARAKGLRQQRVRFWHILRNALIPVVTIISLQFAGLLGGAFFVEAVFSRPGLGRYAIDAIGNRDYPQIQGMVMFLAVVYVLVNLLTDLFYALLDPRVRLD